MTTASVHFSKPITQDTFASTTEAVCVSKSWFQVRVRRSAMQSHPSQHLWRASRYHKSLRSTNRTCSTGSILFSARSDVCACAGCYQSMGILRMIKLFGWEPEISAQSAKGGSMTCGTLCIKLRQLLSPINGNVKWASSSSPGLSNVILRLPHTRHHNGSYARMLQSFALC